MPLSLRRGRVTAVVEEHEGLIRLEVDGAACIAYPQLTGPVEVDDEVLVNVQARELGLGSGGFDLLHANLTRGLELPAAEGAHVMKLPYTPMQWAERHAEEGGELAASLDGMPVVCCSLHSQVAPVCAGLEGKRLAYLQLPGGALSVALSDTVRLLRERGLLVSTVSAGTCFGGEVETVGHGGLAAADAANAAVALNGRPVLAARVSSADERDRHRGVSHHTRAMLSLCRDGVTVAWAAGLEAPDWVEPRTEVAVDGWREACAGLPLSHMGRGPDQEPWFFAAAFAAGKVASGWAG